MKLNLKLNMAWSENISSGLAFMLIMLLSIVVAWMAISAAQKIIKNPPQSIVKAGVVDQNQ